MQEIDLRKDKILKFINNDLELFINERINGIGIINVQMSTGVIIDKILNKKEVYENVCSFNLREESCQYYSVLDFFKTDHKLKNNTYYSFLKSRASQDQNKYLSLLLSDIKALKKDDQNSVKNRWESDFSIYSNNPINFVLEENNSVVDMYFTAKISDKSNYWMLSKSLDFKNDDFCFNRSKDFLFQNGIDVDKEEFSNSFSEILENIYLCDY